MLVISILLAYIFKVVFGYMAKISVTRFIFVVYVPTFIVPVVFAVIYTQSFTFNVHNVIVIVNVIWDFADS